MTNTQKKQNENITAEIKGLKCDKINCGYVDMSIKLADYKSYIDKPCPKCKSSLLTQEDYDIVQALLGVMDLVNAMPKVNPKDPNEVKSHVEFKLDGTGNVNIDITD